MEPTKRRYGRIRGLVLSLGSADFYRDVARNWHGIGLLYLLLVIMLTWIPILGKWQSAVGRFIQEDFPELAIKKGKVTSPVAQPFVISDGQGTPIFILDTTGKTDFDKTDAKILVTEEKFFQRDGNRVQIHDLKDFPDFDLSKETLANWGKTASTWLGLVLFPFVVLWSLVGWLLVMLVAGGIGMAAKGRTWLSFGTVLRLAAVGSTLGMYFAAAVWFFSIDVPPWLYYLICFALTLAYTIFGIKCAESDLIDDEFVDDYDRGEERREERRPPPPSDGGSDAFRSGPTGP
jgi:hypothetical protein